MKRRLLIVMIIILLPGQTAFAHVLITDETNTKGAILHIMADDDPIAGQVSSLYFDAQDQLLNAKGSTIVLTITDADGSMVQLPMKISGTLATVDYTFPVQGVYRLTFTATSNDGTYIFKQSQRVSRGVTASALHKPSYPWAEILVLVSGISIILLFIVALNRRKDIAKQSTF